MKCPCTFPTALLVSPSGVFIFRDKPECGNRRPGTHQTRSVSWPDEPKVFSHQIAYNLIPQIGGEQVDGYTSEEMKLQNEGRKIMHLPELKVSCTCVRVPVVRSHSISVSLRFDKHITVQQAREVLANAPGVKLVDDLSKKMYPMPLDTSDQDLVFVGRIRPDLTDDNGLTLWCCGDQVRKGAATNAVQIAELLVK